MMLSFIIHNMTIYLNSGHIDMSSSLHQKEKYKKQNHKTSRRITNTTSTYNTTINLMNKK